MDDSKKFCIVNLFDDLSVSAGRELICNDFDCPLLLLSTDVCLVRPCAIISVVSVVHECTPSCTFKEITTPRVIEREAIQCNQTVFEHDWSNMMYCLNVYCMPL
jgi:hypothetical protein